MKFKSSCLSILLIPFLFNTLEAQNIQMGLTITIETNLEIYNDDGSNDIVTSNRIENKIKSFFEDKERTDLKGDDLSVNDSLLGLQLNISKATDSEYYIITIIEYFNVSLNNSTTNPIDGWVLMTSETLMHAHIDIWLESFLTVFYENRLLNYLN